MLLSVEDVYSFYGLTLLTEADLKDDEAKSMYSFFLSDIRKKYVKALEKRIREEAGYLGLDIAGTTIESLMRNMRNGLDEQIKKQSAKMAATGTGFNLMDMVKQQMGQKPKAMEGAADAFRIKEKQRPAFGGEPWAKISEAFLAVEKSSTPKEVILSIDHLNDLAHNCCAVLFDLTGTRGGGNGHQEIAKILDEKKHAKHPREFASKMSSDVKEFLKEQGML